MTAAALRRGRISRWTVERRAAALAAAREFPFLLPALLLVGGLMLIPGIYALYESFFNWNPGYPSPYVGFGNYTALFHEVGFGQILVNHAVLLIGVPIWTLAPLVIALVLHERVHAPWLFRSIFLFPTVLSGAVLGILFRALLSENGLVNQALGRLHLHRLEHQWIDSASLVKPTLIGILLWAQLGIGVVIYAAGLAAIPAEELEAAELDGAGWWRRLRHIVIPRMRPMIAFYAAYTTIGIFLFSFGYIFVLTNGGPGYASTTFDFDIYTNALRFGYYGIAAAESVVLFAIVAAIAAFAGGLSWWLGRRNR